MIGARGQQLDGQRPPERPSGIGLPDSAGSRRSQHRLIFSARTADTGHITRLGQYPRSGNPRAGRGAYRSNVALSEAPVPTEVSFPVYEHPAINPEAEAITSNETTRIQEVRYLMLFVDEYLHSTRLGSHMYNIVDATVLPHRHGRNRLVGRQLLRDGIGMIWLPISAWTVHWLSASNTTTTSSTRTRAVHTTSALDRLLSICYHGQAP
jgi:hypothetical protein